MIDWYKISHTFGALGSPYFVFTDKTFQEAHSKHPDVYAQTTRAKANLPEFLCSDFGMHFEYPPDIEFAHGNIVLSGDNCGAEGVPAHIHYPRTDKLSVSVPFLLAPGSTTPLFQFGKGNNAVVYEVDETQAFVFNSSTLRHEVLCCQGSQVFAFVIFEQVDEDSIQKIVEFYGRTRHDPK